MKKQLVTAFQYFLFRRLGHFFCLANCERTLQRRLAAHKKLRVERAAHPDCTGAVMLCLSHTAGMRWKIFDGALGINLERSTHLQRL
jgi:hypothetical protein